MHIMSRMLLLFLATAVLMAEDATIPYAHLHKICSVFPDNLLIRITCKKEIQEPLALTIQVNGVVVSQVTPDSQGLVKLPLNEQWISENAVLHANRPKGSMTITVRYVPYSFSRFSVKDGSIDLMEYLTAMKRSKDQMDHLRKFFKGDLETGQTQTIPFMIDPSEGAKATLHYTVNGIKNSVIFPAEKGKIVVRLEEVADASAAMLLLDPKDAKIDFLEPQVETVDSAPVIP